MQAIVRRWSFVCATAKPEVKRLDQGGPALGLLSDAAYVQGHMDTEPEDVMLLYSDGLIEAANLAVEEFGDSRLAALVTQSIRGDPERIRDSILLAVRDFLGNEGLQDDLTCVVSGSELIVNRSTKDTGYRAPTRDIATQFRDAASHRYPRRHLVFDARRLIPP